MDSKQVAAGLGTVHKKLNTILSEGGLALKGKFYTAKGATFVISTEKEQLGRITLLLFELLASYKNNRGIK